MIALIESISAQRARELREDAAVRRLGRRVRADARRPEGTTERPPSPLSRLRGRPARTWG